MDLRGSSESNAPAAPGGRRPRRLRTLAYLYFALAAFALLTVCSSLFVINRIADNFVDAVRINQEWAVRLDRISELNQLAVAVNAPGNDVFISRDVEGESTQLEEALLRFRQNAAIARADIETHVASNQARSLLSSLDQLDESMSDLVAQAHQIFGYFPNDDARAAARMAAMDRDYAEISATLAGLGTEVRAIQKDNLDKQAAIATSIRMAEFLIAGLIIIMVAAVTFYGHRLSQRMKDTERSDLDHLLALGQSEARTRAVLASTFDPVITTDEAGMIQTASNSVKKVFGWTVDELIGRHISTLILKAPDRDGASSLAGKIGEPQETQERQALHRDGRQFPIELSVSRVDLPGRDLPIFTGIVHDITKRKKSEEELTRYREHLEKLVEERTAALSASHERLRLAERLASIGTLAAGLGQDLNTLLFPRRCRLDAIEAAELDREVRAELVTLRHSIEYLQKLSDGLRLLSLDPTTPRASSEMTDLQRWWSDVGPLFQAAVRTSAALVVELPDGPVMLAVPTHGLTQAVFNLVLNAGEATGDDGTIRIWARQQGNGTAVQLGVSDDGHGMSEEVRRQALDPFFTTKHRRMSTGLGLTLAHSVVSSAGGTVEIQSQPGEGTTVVLTLPTVDLNPSAGRRTTERLAVVSLSDRRMGALFAAILEPSGFRIEYRESASSNGAIVWITDDSPSALKAAKTFLDSGAGRQVIVLSASAGDGRRSSWQTLGAVVVPAEEGFARIREAVRSICCSDQGFGRGVAQ